MKDPTAKSAARETAFARRAEAHCAGLGSAPLLSSVLADYRGKPLSGYLPIRTEIDPLPAMTEAAAHGPVGVPVIEGRDLPLRFRRWEPGCALELGPFGVQAPCIGDWMVPELLIVPLVAFDRRGGRLGYGGGYYDRTLAELRAQRAVLAIGFAFAAQEIPAVPKDPTDQRLDLIVTEAEVIEPRP